jgi:hypothetical protein
MHRTFRFAIREGAIAPRCRCPSPGVSSLTWTAAESRGLFLLPVGWCGQRGTRKPEVSNIELRGGKRKGILLRQGSAAGRHGDRRRRSRSCSRDALCHNLSRCRPSSRLLRSSVPPVRGARLRWSSPESCLHSSVTTCIRLNAWCAITSSGRLARRTTGAAPG